MRAIWVMPLPWGPPRSGVMPTSVKAWRSASRFDPQIETWSSSSTVVLLSWAIDGREMTETRSAAPHNRRKTGKIRWDMRASGERRNSTPRSTNQKMISCGVDMAEADLDNVAHHVSHYRDALGQHPPTP